MFNQGLVNRKTIHIDGTKLEAIANTYTFIWDKSIKKYKQGIKTQWDNLVLKNDMIL